jgi:uncharacterized membrane protein YbhN (UPF0104 family)
MRRFETLLILLALVFYVWFLRHFGAGRIYGYVRLAGWGLILTITLESVSRIANTLGWRATIKDYPPSLSFAELFGARIAGEAVDYFTPTAQLGGQFVMAMMVRRKLAMAVGLATVVVAALAEMVGQIGFVTSALVISIPLEAKVHDLLWPVMAGLAVVLALAAAFLWVQMRKPFSWLWRAAVKLDLPQLKDPEIEEAAGQADAILSDFYGRHRARLFVSCLCYLVAWSMGPIEIYILLRLLHQPAPLMVALTVEGVGLLIERTTFLIPGKLVSQEGGKALILAMLGYPAGIGFAIGFLRRIKEMAWVGFGLGALTLHRMTAERDAGLAIATPQEE